MMIGTVVDQRYKILSLLGEGGMGKVFEAEHTGTGRKVAVKIILNEALKTRPDLVARFQREARTSAAIDTKHIVEIIDTGVDPTRGCPYMVMELMRGSDCAQLVRRVGPLPVPLALKIVAQTCIGLEKAHAAGVVHRDIKPANLFLAERDEGEIVVKILDFGIAKVLLDDTQIVDHQLTQTGAMMGSPLYMSPEQARGNREIDHRADVWSLGVVLYQLLCGRTPYHHLQALGELIIAICGEPPPNVQTFAPWVPPDVAKVAQDAIVRDPDGRFQSVREMLEAVRAQLADGSTIHEDDLKGLGEQEKSIVAPVIVPEESEGETPANTGQGEATAAGLVSTNSEPTTRMVRRPKKKKRNPWLARVGAAVVGVAVGAGGLYGLLRDKPEPTTPAPPAVKPQPSSVPVASLTFSEKQPLQLLGDSFSGYSSFRSKAFQESLGKDGIVYRYKEALEQDERLEALEKGKADLAVTTIDHVLMHSKTSQVVALIDTTAGADAIVVNNKRYPQLSGLGALQSLVEQRKLRGKKTAVAYATGTPSEYLARLLSARLDSFDLSAFQIRPVDDASAAFKALTQPTEPPAVAVLWEPYVTKAREAGYRVVLSSGDVPGAIQDVLVASKRLIQRAPETLQKVVSGFYLQMDRGVTRPNVLRKQIADDASLSEKDAKIVMTGIRFYTALMAKKKIEGGVFAKRVKATESVLLIEGMMEQSARSASAILEPRFINVAAKNTERLIEGLKSKLPRMAKLLSEGGEQNLEAPSVDGSTLSVAPVIGRLGQLPWNPAQPETFLSSQKLDALLLRLEDFSHISTVVTLVGATGTPEQRKHLLDGVQTKLRRAGLRHALVWVDGSGGGLLSIELRRISSP